MRYLPSVIGISLLLVLCTGVWVLRYRPQWLEPALEQAEEDEDVDPQKLEIPVHAAAIQTATLHRYVNAIGTIQPAPARPGAMAGVAQVAAPSAGIIAEILCEVGQTVKKGDPLLQIDDRVARAAEVAASAALQQAQASRARVYASPRPEEVDVARHKIEHARTSLEFATQNDARQQELLKNQGTSEKNVEQARLDLASARNELAAAENEERLLKPTPESLAEEDAKVAAAQAAFESAKTQREMLRIVAPIDATIASTFGNPGESVDPSRPLINLVAADRLVASASIPAGDARQLSTGLPVRVELAASGDAKTIDALIRTIGPDVDPKSNTVSVSIDLPADSGAKSGETVMLQIIAEEHKDALAVPIESVVADENGDTFIALINGDQATHKTVQAGIREGKLVEIKGNDLKAGDAVVSSGAYGLAKFQVARVKLVEK